MQKNQLHILGPAELRTADGKLEHSFLAGPKRLALLSILIMDQKGGFVRRDRLLPLFWPQKDQKSARNALSNMLYHIRKSLGSDVLHTRGSEELGVNPERLWCDVIAFEHAIGQRELHNAVELYKGHFLEGFHLSGVSVELEQWLDHERNRLRSSYMDALENLAVQAEKKDNFVQAASWWKKIASEDPLDTRVIKKWVESLAASGRYVEALKKAEEHGNRLEEELGFDADDIRSEITENLNKIRLTASRPQTVRDEMYKNASVAVLPFEELGSAPEISYLASGLHHDLLTRLAGVSDLKVISRTSVLRYKETKMTIPEIANRLGVNTIVEGAIQQSGDQLRLHIQTINAGSDEHEVSETFDRKLTTDNLFEIQSDLAEKIANNLKTFFTPKEKKRAFEWSSTENVKAYRYYSMGRRQLDRRTESSMRKALEYFKKAVDTDPGYALAWVGLCDAFTLLYDYGHDSGNSGLQEASRAVQQALKLDPGLAEAHASMGLLHSNRHEGPDSIRELQVSVDLKPNYAEAHNWLSWNYQLLGEADKALESARIAVELNPLSPEAVSNLAVSLLYNGYAEESLEESRRAIDLEPDWMTSSFYYGLALYELQKTRMAAEVLREIESPWAGVGPKATFAVCRYKLGDIKTSRDILSEFESKESWFAAGLLHAMFGRNEKAIEYFKKIRFWDDWPTLAFYYLYPDILSEIRSGIIHSELLINVKKSRGLVSEMG
jgi:TolB-like protein/Tfp pilus assembly protein PilF